MSECNGSNAPMRETKINTLGAQGRRGEGSHGSPAAVCAVFLVLAARRSHDIKQSEELQNAASMLCEQLHHEAGDTSRA